MKATKRTFKSLIVIALSAFIMNPALAQVNEDAKDGTFQNELLNHLVGKWDVTAVVHKEKFTIDLKAEWVMNHQYLHIHFRSHEIVPWLRIPFESELFFAYNRSRKQHIFYEMTVHGANGWNETPGFGYAYQAGNEFKLIKKFAGLDTLGVQRFTWEPASKSWHIDARLQVGGKEGEPFIEMKLVAAKPSKE